jgi:predicted GTPase
MERKRTIIMGAAGRDFHNFNTYFRDDESYEVVAFTAEQIPHIEERRYPAVLAGKFYPKGIPIYPESKLTELIKQHSVQEVVFSYSDVSYQYVMNRSAIVNAAGADFKLIGPTKTMIKSKKPVIAVCAVRTGCGKSQTTRKICEILKRRGKKVVAIRHPMPYGDLAKQTAQRFASYADMDKEECTIEEREEYEPYVQRGLVIYSGVDYGAILKRAEAEADVILWDGGNNDFSFYKPDLYITVTDPHRPGDELSYYPGEFNLRVADVIIINKEDSANPINIRKVEENARAANPKAMIVHADSPVTPEKPEVIKGKRVLVVEDGPTLTHGGMKFGAGVIAAKNYGAKEIIDPRSCTVGEITETFKKYPGIGALLPAMGYGKQQIKDLEATINRCDCDSVVIGTPIDLSRLLKISKPTTRVEYNLAEKGKPDLESILDAFIKKHRL